MYNNDSNSLNAGAPDIRLSGNQQMASYGFDEAMAESRQAYDDARQKGIIPFDMEFEEYLELMQDQSKAPQQNSGIMASAPGTYSQKRKQMMAGGGIAGLKQTGKPGGLVEPGISKYGMLDFITKPLGKLKDKIVDDIIPNELKNPAALATIAGLGLNQFGLPIGIGSLKKGAGQNWLGDLLGAAIPGDTQFNTVLGDTLPFRYEDITSNPLPGGFDQIVSETLAKDMSGIMGGRDAALMKIAGMLPDTANVPSTLQRYQKAIADAAKTKSDQSTLKSIYDTMLGDTTRDGSTFNWKTPVAAGLAAGAYTASQPRDTLPMDETGINFQTAQEAMDDPNLRFKPRLEDTQLAASGGRIGFDAGGNYEAKIKELMDMGMSREMAESLVMSEGPTVYDVLDVDKKASGGRIGFANGNGAAGSSGAYAAWKKGIKNGVLSPDISFWDFLALDNTPGLDLPEKAEGGRIGYAGGADYYSNLYSRYAQEMIQAGNTPIPIEDFVAMIKEQEGRAQGGRIGYANAGEVDPEYNGWKKIYEKNPGVAEMHENHPKYLKRYESENKASGGRIGYKDAGGVTKKRTGIMKMLAALEERFPELMMYGSIGAGSILPFLKEGGRVPAQEGGLMDLGGMEKDYRQEGGFVPIGGKEKADDVPARLSKNEFVFTADAVRSAGGGDIDEGAAVMERLMENLEAGGEVSEDSQGLEGARSMFANAQELEKRII